MNDMSESPGRPRKVPLPAKLPNRLREQRLKKHLSLAELARRTGFNAQTIFRYESAERDIPLSRLEALADALGVPITSLLNPPHIDPAQLRPYAGVEIGANGRVMPQVTLAAASGADLELRVHEYVLQFVKLIADAGSLSRDAERHLTHELWVVVRDVLRRLAADEKS